MRGMDLDDAVDELYGVALEDFLATRTALVARAKAAGAKDAAKSLGALRKPTVAGWAINLLVRHRPDDAARVADLAGRLRTATERLDGGALKQLGRERSTLVDDIVAATVDLAREAGGTVSPVVAREIGTTFVAAMATAEACEAVLSGRLTRALEYAGFGDVDLTEATARPLRVVRDGERAPRAARRVSEPSAQRREPDPGVSQDETVGSPVETVDSADRRCPGDAPESEPESDGDTWEGVAERAAEAERAEEERAAALAAAEAELARAMHAATRAGDRHRAVSAELELAENRVATLQRDLTRARTARDTTADALADAQVAMQAAQREVRRARAGVEVARAQQA